MSQEKVNKKQENDAWVPGVFVKFNKAGLREENAVRWGKEAKELNGSRPIGKKLTFRERETAKGVMHAEAITENEEIDRGELPKSLYLDKLGLAILKEAGINQRHFPDIESLDEALRQSPELRYSGSYTDVTSRAAEQVKANGLPGQQPKEHANK